MEAIHAKMTTSISQFRGDITGAIKRAAGMPFAVLNNNKPSFYVVSPELFEELSELLFEKEIAAKVRYRKERGEFVSVNIEDL